MFNWDWSLPSPPLCLPATALSLSPCVFSVPGFAVPAYMAVTAKELGSFADSV